MAELLVQDGLSVSRTPAEPMHVLHCAPVDAAAIGAAIGLELPADMLRVTVSAAGRALHLAPDEWLLVGWAPAMGLTLPQPCSLVDVSSRSSSLAIQGGLASRLVASGCPLDFEEMPPGLATRTLLGKVQIVLERHQDCFRMHYGRSFDDYVTQWLRTAASDLPAAVMG